MRHSTFFEPLEQRLCLSATVLGAGQTALFDFDGNGVNDGVLTNTGTVNIEYDVTGGNGLAINLLADGAKFSTNTWVNVADTNPAADFSLADAEVGRSSWLGCGKGYAGIRGTSTVTASSIGTFNDYKGDVGSLMTTVGDLGTLWTGCGNVGDVTVAGSAGKINASGDIVGNIIVGGDLGILSFDDVYGTTEGRAIVAGGHIGQVIADTISGGQTDSGWLGLFAGNGVDSITACTLTAGSNSTLYIALQGGLGALSVGTLDGGTATADGVSQTTLSVDGDVGKLMRRQDHRRQRCRPGTTHHQHRLSTPTVPVMSRQAT